MAGALRSLKDMPASASFTAPANAAPASLLRKLVTNLGWLGAQKIFVMLLGVFTSGLIARSLGPENLGMLSAAQAIVGIVGVAAMGVDATVFTQELYQNSENENAIMGGTTAVLAVTGLVSWLMLVLYAWLFASTNWLFFLTIVVCGLRLLVTFPAPVAMWFQARMCMRDVVLPNTVGTLVLRGWQLLGGFMKWGAVSIAAAEVISLLYIMSASFRAYGRHGRSLRGWMVNWGIGWSILRRSIPGLVAGSLVVFLTRMDVLMLRWLRGEAEAGYYSAASSLTESLLFMGGMLASVLAPALMIARKENPGAYHAARRVHLRLSSAAGWLVAAVLSIMSTPVVTRVYGAAYLPGAAVLAVHAFLLVPCLSGVALQCHLTLEKNLRHLVLCLLVALAVNATLGVLLIPPMGGVGAALAALAAAISGYLITPLVLPAVRENGVEALLALLWPVPSMKVFRTMRDHS